MKLLNNKIAFITGGTRGIGKSIVETFAKQGAKVIFTFIKSIKEAKNIELLLNNYSEINSYQADNNNINQIQYVVNKIIDKYHRIDILVNNVGITYDKLLIKMEPKDWSNIIDTNLKSIFFITKLVIKEMMKKRMGSIINMSSISGIYGNIGQTNYAASKAGIIGFTKSVAKEFGSKNIRCNAIAPGIIDTDMTFNLKKNQENLIKLISLKRIGTTQDIANSCLFLASDLSNYITGEVLNVNGGIYF